MSLLRDARRYRMRAEHAGFKASDLVGLTVNVQDNIQENFSLEIGPTSESVTVSASGVNINATDAAVGTVIDHQFVDNIPMNGRSFQTLILLSPGVVTNNPNGADSGEYSVNGQRTDANGFYVDGASANNTISSASTGGNSGMLPNSTALGTTTAMLQLDAMEEFRISTSTYSAEFGNHPGGQISFRSVPAPTPGTARPSTTSATPLLTPITGSTTTARPRPRHRRSARTTLAARWAGRSQFPDYMTAQPSLPFLLLRGLAPRYTFGSVYLRRPFQWHIHHQQHVLFTAKGRPVG